MHYNVLADQAGTNMQPWFCYGADVSRAERRELHRRFYASGDEFKRFRRQRAGHSGRRAYCHPIVSRRSRRTTRTSSSGSAGASAYGARSLPTRSAAACALLML